MTESKLFASTQSPDEMIAAGERFGQSLEAYSCIALVGDLGAGKTHFTKGIARAIGISDSISSPTFSLVHELGSGRLPLFHLDFYRLESPDELAAIGWHELLGEPAVVIVEWADKFPEACPAETRWLRLSIADSGAHEVHEIAAP